MNDLSPVRAALGIDALIGQAKPLHRTAADQVLLHDLRRIFGSHVAIPNRLWIHHHRGAVFALVQAACFVDPHLTGQARRLRQLLQLGVQVALSVRSTRRARSAFRTYIMANKDMMLELRQSAILPGRESRLTPRRRTVTVAPKLSTSRALDPPASERMIA